MKLVRIIKDWTWPDLLHFTPQHWGIWDNIQFTLDSVQECDYTIVLNTSLKEVTVNCPPQHIWSIVQEPPTDFTKTWHINPSYYFRMFTCDPDLVGPEYVHTHPALPWHVNRDYDFLTSCSIPQKTRLLSCITSRKQYYEGHRSRMRFLETIRKTLSFDLLATYEYYLRGQEPTHALREHIRQEQLQYGFLCVEDKWDGLAPYRYSLAIENFSNSYYWSEKLADCFLAWTMPIYYGCTRITDYFPEEAMILIDIHNPETHKLINAAITEDRWHKNLDALTHARQLVLEKYQLFPFLVHQIHQFESCYGAASKKQPVTISPRPEIMAAWYTPSSQNSDKSLDSRFMRWMLKLRHHVKRVLPL